MKDTIIREFLCGHTPPPHVLDKDFRCDIPWDVE